MQIKDHNIDRNNEKIQMKKLLLLVIILLIGIFLFIFVGINSNNFSFNFPRRFNKIMAIIVVSYSIGYSSIVFQTITNNKINDPKITKYLVIVAYVCCAFSLEEWLKKKGSIPKV